MTDQRTAAPISTASIAAYLKKFFETLQSQLGAAAKSTKWQDLLKKGVENVERARGKRKLEGYGALGEEGKETFFKDNGDGTMRVLGKDATGYNFMEFAIGEDGKARLLSMGDQTYDSPELAVQAADRYAKDGTNGFDAETIEKAMPELKEGLENMMNEAKPRNEKTDGGKDDGSDEAEEGDSVDAVQCKGTTQGSDFTIRCKNMTTNPNGYCDDHQDQAGGKEGSMTDEMMRLVAECMPKARCAYVKNNRRCKRNARVGGYCTQHAKILGKVSARTASDGEWWEIYEVKDGVPQSSDPYIQQMEKGYDGFYVIKHEPDRGDREFGPYGSIDEAVTVHGLQNKTTQIVAQKCYKVEIEYYTGDSLGYGDIGYGGSEYEKRCRNVLVDADSSDEAQAIVEEYGRNAYGDDFVGMNAVTEFDSYEEYQELFPYSNAERVARLAGNFATAPRVPDDVDTTDNGSCPLCGDPNYDGQLCNICGYEEPLEGFGPIDLETDEDYEEYEQDAVEQEFDSGPDFDPDEIRLDNELEDKADELVDSVEEYEEDDESLVDDDEMQFA